MIAILGAGIVGRLAKLMFPQAELFEAKAEHEKITSDFGLHYILLPIPYLTCKQFKRVVTIDGKKPTVDLIIKYKEKKEIEGAAEYGDLRQFEPEQNYFSYDIPIVEANYGHRAKQINLEEKSILFDNGKEVKYSMLISTIPLINLIKISNLFSHFSNEAGAFFKHRPIYIRFTKVDPSPMCFENYITDPDNPIYRENVIGDTKNEESLFKLEGAVKLYPGKIYNNRYSENITADLLSYDIHCIGRYAQWDNRVHLWHCYEKLKTLKGVL